MKNKATWPYTAFVTKLAASGSDLVYSTYLGGSTQESAQAIAVDKAGNAYVAGVTWSSDFPVTRGALQTQRLGDATFTAFVSVLNPGGTALVYSTYLGSKESYTGDRANAIAVDAAGEAFVAGTTDGPSFPVTSGAFQTKIKTYTQTGDQATGFVAKFNAAGSSLIYCTYLGGSGDGNSGKNWIADSVNAIALDASGDAYLAGTTYSLDFPVSKDAFQSTNKASKDEQNNGFAAKLDSTGTALEYSTYLGGTGNASGPADPYGHGDTINALALDSSGNAYVAGHTYSSDFPVTSLAFQKTNKSQHNGNAFVSKINPDGSALVYSTFLGGKNDDSANAIAVDSRGEAFVAGAATSSDFPITKGAYQTQNFAAYATAFATELDAGGSALLYSTFLGGSTNDIAYGLALDATDMTYVAGQTSSTDFPVTSGSYQTKNHAAGATAFVTKMLLTAPAGPAATTTTLISSANPAPLGTPLTFTATVSSKSAMPSGNVVFTIDTNPSVSANLNGSGRATYTTKSLAVGAHSVTAAYPGNSSFAPSTSAALTETITKPQAVPPTFSPAVGNYRTPQLVTLTDATKGAAIYFTTNGNTPSTSSTVFKNPIKVAETTTIKAVAAASGYSNSIVASGTYFITPSVTTQEASGIMATSALLHATVNAHNATTQYWFAYGTSSALGATTAKTGALTGTTATRVTVILTGLKSKTTYYFMAVASNAAGTTNGDVLSFKTE